MKLSEMRRILETEGIQLTKSLGQNFLHDANQLDRIVAAAGLKPGDHLFEIGPGLGPLTGRLLDSAEQVLAVEKDSRLVDYLRRRFRDIPKLRLVHDDALQYIRGRSHVWTGWKLVSNLPYSVASPILVELAMGEAPPDSLTVTLQSEVAQRLRAEAASADYGVLTLLVQLSYVPVSWFVIPAGSFFPAPDVESTCITLQRRPSLLLPRSLEPTFRKIVKRSFAERRKMMFKLLKTEWPLPRLQEAFTRTGLDPQIRAERVTLEQFVTLTQTLGQPPQPSPHHE